MKTKEKIDLESKYSKKIQQLFELKRDGYLKLDNESFKGYEKFGFTKEDIPELIELAMDDSSDKIDYEIYEEECDRHFFATISAVRILGKLGAIEEIEAFFNKMYLDFDNDFYQEAIIDFLGDIGAEAIPFIENDLLKVNDDKLTLFDGLRKIIERHPTHKDRVENFLIKYLNTTDDDSTHIAFAILLLVDISGAKHIDFIENIFKTRDVDTLVQGDFEDIEIKLGLKENRVHPRPKTKFDELIEAFALEEDRVIIHPVRTKPKIGRNDPCPCGSGKKYKKCCLNK